MRTLIVQYCDNLIQERGKSEKQKLATYLKEICKIESSAEEVSSKTVGRSCKSYYLDAHGAAGADMNQADRLDIEHRNESPPVLGLACSLHGLQSHELFNYAFDERCMRSYVGSRLISPLEPTAADRLILGEEFWVYRTDRELDYVSVPGIIGLADEHKAPTQLLKEYMVFIIALASQMDQLEDFDAAHMPSMAGVSLQSSKRASALVPAVRPGGLNGERAERTPVFLPAQNWSNEDFRTLSFSFCRKLRTYDAGGDDFVVPLIRAGTPCVNHLRDVRTISQQEGLFSGERPCVYSRLLERNLTLQTPLIGEALKGHGEIVSNSGLF